MHVQVVIAAVVLDLTGYMARKAVRAEMVGATLAAQASQGYM